MEEEGVKVRMRRCMWGCVGDGLCLWKGRTVTLKVKLVSFEVRQHSITLNKPVSGFRELHQAASSLLAAEMKAIAPSPLRLRLMGEKQNSSLHSSSSSSSSCFFSSSSTPPLSPPPPPPLFQVSDCLPYYTLIPLPTREGQLLTPTFNQAQARNWRWSQMNQSVRTILLKWRWVPERRKRRRR